MASDAVSKRPTFEEEASKFKGFATTDGETSEGGQTAEETATLAAEETQKKADKAVAEKNAKAKNKLDIAPDDAGEEAEDDSILSDADQAAKDAAKAKAAAKKDDAGEDEDDDKGKTPKSAAKRIGDLTKARRTAERERDAANDRNADLERRLANLERGVLTKPEGAAKTSSDDAEPKAEDFEFGENDPKYLRAIGRYDALQITKAQEAAREEARQKQVAVKEAAERNEKKETLYDAGRAKYEDFESVVIDAIEGREFPLSPTLGKLCLNSDVGIDVIYYLASNPKLAAKIDGKTPVEQAAYFGRLEAQFSSDTDATQGKGTVPKTPKPAKTTQAPAPIHGARGAGGNQQPVTADTNDFAAFEASVRAAQK